MRKENINRGRKIVFIGNKNEHQNLELGEIYTVESYDKDFNMVWLLESNHLTGFVYPKEIKPINSKVKRLKE